MAPWVLTWACSATFVSPFYWVITIAQMQKVQALRDIKTDLEELSTHQNHDNDRLDLCICRIIECVFVDRGRHSKFWSINNQQVFPGQQYTSISIVRLKKFPMESAVTSALQYRVTLLIVTASWDNSESGSCMQVHNIALVPHLTGNRVLETYR